MATCSFFVAAGSFSLLVLSLALYLQYMYINLHKSNVFGARGTIATPFQSKGKSTFQSKF